jgi:hypothetical protein
MLKQLVRLHVTIIVFRGSKMSFEATRRLFLLTGGQLVLLTFLLISRCVKTARFLSQQGNKWSYKIAVLSVQVTVSESFSLSVPEPVKPTS